MGIVLLDAAISITFGEILEIVSDLELVIGIIALYDLIRVPGAFGKHIGLEVNEQGDLPIRECKGASREGKNNKSSNSSGADHFKADIDDRSTSVKAGGWELEGRRSRIC